VTGLPNLCMAGGVALNCVANGRIMREKIFDRIWIQPAAGDAGGALGAALAVWHSESEKMRVPRKVSRPDAMRASLLGPEFSESETLAVLRAHGAIYQRFDDESLAHRVAELLQEQKVIGWFQGRMEFGPRALGNRSILGDARSPSMQSKLNLKIKYRESFRPFAPVVLRERVGDYFDLEEESPYMLLVAPVKNDLRRSPPLPTKGFDLLRYPLSTIPAVTHVDYSARVQTVTRQQNAKLYALLQAFERAAGCGVLVNTSFNVRGEPMVCTPEDAYRCFVNTEMDVLILGNFLLERTAQASLRPVPTVAPRPD
jgi:carbamoyltransferase